MNKKDDFKEYVRKNPHLIKFVKEGSMSWQKFYEIYDLYGEEETAWKEYAKKEEPIQEVKKETSTPTDLMGFFKSIDLDSLQSGMNSLQRVLGLVGELTTKETPAPKTDTYKPRPLYKHFED